MTNVETRDESTTENVLRAQSCWLEVQVEPTAEIKSDLHRSEEIREVLSRVYRQLTFLLEYWETSLFYGIGARKRRTVSIDILKTTWAEQSAGVFLQSFLS